MPIHPKRVQQVMRYAVAVASSADDFQRQELGPIHLLKYVYLADLAYAERNGGQTYTGTTWCFHHFGPWAVKAWQQIPEAMSLHAIRHRLFQSDYQDDASRWSSEETNLEEKLEPTMPHEVSRGVSRAVKDFGNDTSGLLHYVYQTAPMLKAAPGEQLDFSTVAAQRQDPALRSEPEPLPQQLSKADRKRRRAAHDALRERFQEALKKRRQRRARTAAEPTHKRAHLAEVLEWVDSLAGEPIEPLEGELIVAADVWKSPARSGS